MVVYYPLFQEVVNISVLKIPSNYSLEFRIFAVFSNLELLITTKITRITVVNNLAQCTCVPIYIWCTLNYLNLNYLKPQLFESSALRNARAQRRCKSHGLLC